MKIRLTWMVALGLATSVMTMCAQSQGPETARDTSSHTVQFVKVSDDVKLEVLDWGGTGRPVILLAGLGFDAHVYDTFAPKLTGKNHVYGITRRGFGASSKPKARAENYGADLLGDDVLAVMDALKIERPVLIGHSLGGEELSSIGSRFPERVAGLIYLDAGYAYAYYDVNSAQGDPVLDSAILRKQVDQLFSLIPMKERKAQVKQLLDSTLPRFEGDLRDVQERLKLVPDSAPVPADTDMGRIAGAIQKGVNVYSGVKCPVLAIYADPHDMGPDDGKDAAARAKQIADDQVRTSAQADSFQAGNPQAHVVRLPNADHFVFRSNETDVLRETNAFLAQLR